MAKVKRLREYERHQIAFSGPPPEGWVPEKGDSVYVKVCPGTKSYTYFVHDVRGKFVLVTLRASSPKRTGILFHIKDVRPIGCLGGYAKSLDNAIDAIAVAIDGNSGQPPDQAGIDTAIREIESILKGMP